MSYAAKDKPIKKKPYPSMLDPYREYIEGKLSLDLSTKSNRQKKHTFKSKGRDAKIDLSITKKGMFGYIVRAVTVLVNST